MHTIRHIISASIVVAACTFLSCNGSTGGTSTPTDSTVSSGTAPVHYSEGTPATTVDTSNQGRTEQLKTARGSMRADTSTTPPNASTGSGVSNTTDKSTTSGSAKAGKK